MTTYKNLSDSVVAKIDDDGISLMSCSVEHPEYLAWLADGNTPEPAFTPEELAAQRWEQIKHLRDELTDNGGCLVGDKWFHSDTKSKQQQMALVMLGANIPAGLQWKTMDGTFTTMTQTLAGQLFGAQVAREQAIFTHAEMLRADPDADITQGWPERFA